MSAVETKFSYFAGLDLGQTHESTALAIVERTSVEGDAVAPSAIYAVRHLERFPIGTPYADVFGRVIGMFAAAPLQDGTLLVDQTGVGKPVIQLLRRRDNHPHFVPVSIAAGLEAALDGHGGWLVPKLDLVGGLQVLLQAKRLKVAESLPEAGTLVRELTNFRFKPLPANSTDPLAAWREGQHDDLVFAVALAVWEAERYVKWDVHFLGEVPAVPGRPHGLSQWRFGQW
jgi:hypothetical protein